MRTTPDRQPTSSVQTADIEAAAFLYHLPRPLLSHHYDEPTRRTVFIFQASPQDLANFYGPAGETARKLLLARRTLLGLVHEGRR